MNKYFFDFQPRSVQETAQVLSNPMTSPGHVIVDDAAMDDDVSNTIIS